MTTAKLNKDKLKRMMEQKDAVTVNLGKKRKGDLATKPVLEKVSVRHPVIQEPTFTVQAPASLVKVIKPIEAPSSSRAVDKAPTLPLDASLALRWAKSVVTKEDMDEYGKLNTDVVKRDLTHSLMKVLHYIFFFFWLIGNSSL